MYYNRLQSPFLVHCTLNSTQTILAGVHEHTSTQIRVTNQQPAAWITEANVCLKLENHEMHKYYFNLNYRDFLAEHSDTIYSFIIRTVQIHTKHAPPSQPNNQPYLNVPYQCIGWHIFLVRSFRMLTRAEDANAENGTSWNCHLENSFG